MAKKEKGRLQNGKSLRNDLASRIGGKAGRNVKDREISSNPLARSLSVKMKSKSLPIVKNGPGPRRPPLKPSVKDSMKTAARNSREESPLLGELKIKNTSQPTLLRIHNLEKGTSVFDVRKIMEKIGIVRSVILKEFKRTATAEVFFADEKNCPTAMKLLDGRKADGHVLACGVTSKSALLSKDQFDQLSKTMRKPFDGTVWDRDLS